MAFIKPCRFCNHRKYCDSYTNMLAHLRIVGKPFNKVTAATIKCEEYWLPVGANVRFMRAYKVGETTPSGSSRKIQGGYITETGIVMQEMEFTGIVTGERSNRTFKQEIQLDESYTTYDRTVTFTHMWILPSEVTSVTLPPEYLLPDLSELYSTN